MAVIIIAVARRQATVTLFAMPKPIPAPVNIPSLALSPQILVMSVVIIAVARRRTSIVKGGRRRFVIVPCEGLS
jgi:hypothetical protein